MPRRRTEPRPLDFTFYNAGSFFLVTLRNQQARDHLDRVLDDEAQRWGDAVAVEPRYAVSFAEALINDGFEVA